MKVRVLFFALYRERVGTSHQDMELTEGATVTDLIAALAQEYPQLSSEPRRIVAAVNQEYVDQSHLLREGDEIALIPPVSGGCPW